MRLRIFLIAAAAATALSATQASATAFYINYSGTSAANGAFSAALTGDEVNGVINSIFGTRTSTIGTYTVTGLSPYAGADQHITGVFPFADFNGISYSTTDNNSYNFYSSGGGAFELNSASNPGGNASNDAPLSPESISAAVPESATWAMMLLGFGMMGLALRKRSNVRTTVSYA